MSDKNKTENIATEPKTRGRKKTHNLPNKVKCIVSGEMVPQYHKLLAKRITKYYDGSSEKFISTFISAPVVKRMKAGESIDEIRADYPEAQVPKSRISKEIIEQYTTTRPRVVILEDGSLTTKKELNAEQKAEEVVEVEVKKAAKATKKTPAKKASKAKSKAKAAAA